MVEEQALISRSVDDFFRRSGLDVDRDRAECFNYVKESYPDNTITLATCQGFCSFTFFVGDQIILQFRPVWYCLDLSITDKAREIYGDLAPETRYMTTLPRNSLLVYAMNRIEGVSFKTFRASTISIEYRVRLCRDFATFLSRAWHQKTDGSIPLGTVGRSIVSRLKSLSTDLPVRFQPIAKKILRELPRIESLPWVLTHGDIVDSNLMVNPSSGRLMGIVDWAEAEYLPFGLCLYGLEEILGEMKPAGFEYHDADQLRNVFWKALEEQIPELQKNGLIETVKLARDLGVLLWHGIAFDDGRIDRVVEENRDDDEICRLDAFLRTTEPPSLDILY